MKTPEDIAADAAKEIHAWIRNADCEKYPEDISGFRHELQTFTAIIARHIAPLVEERDKLRSFVDGLDVFESYDTEYAVRNGLVGRRQWARNAQIWLHQGESLYRGGPKP